MSPNYASSAIRQLCPNYIPNMPRVFASGFFLTMSDYISNIPQLRANFVFDRLPKLSIMRVYFYYHRYTCEDCGAKFSTGRARTAHQCGRAPPPPKRRREDGPSSSREGENVQTAVNDLFKIINIPITPTTPAVTEELEGEMDRLADILR